MAGTKDMCWGMFFMLVMVFNIGKAHLQSYLQITIRYLRSPKGISFIRHPLFNILYLTDCCCMRLWLGSVFWLPLIYESEILFTAIYPMYIYLTPEFSLVPSNLPEYLLNRKCYLCWP